MKYANVANKYGKVDGGDADRRKRIAIILTASEFVQFRLSP